MQEDNERTPFIQRGAATTVKTNNNIKKVYTELVHFLARWRDDYSGPYPRIINFLQGTRFVTETLWPTAFAGLLLHDLITFWTQSNDRYGNQWHDSLWGNSPNQLGWTSHYGSDLAAEPLYWLAPALITGGALGVGLLQFLRRSHFILPANPDSFAVSQLLQQKLPLDSDHLKFESQRFNNLVLRLKDTANYAGWFKAQRAIQELAQLAEGLDQNSLNALREIARFKHPKNPAQLNSEQVQYLLRHFLVNAPTFNETEIILIEGSDKNILLTLMEQKINSFWVTRKDALENNRVLKNEVIMAVHYHAEAGLAGDHWVLLGMTIDKQKRAIKNLDKKNLLVAYFDPHADQENAGSFFTIDEVANFFGDKFGIESIKIFQEKQSTDRVEHTHNPCSCSHEIIEKTVYFCTPSKSKEEKFNLTAIEKKHSAALHKRTFFSNFITRIHTNYQLWSLGESVEFPWYKTAHVLFWFSTLYGIYANIRLWEMFAQKFVGLGEYIKDHVECSRQNKIFLYLPDYGNYECTVCGDWDFLTPRQTFTSQGCLDGLLALPQSPEFILGNMTRILQHPDFKNIDFSKQDWNNWTEQQWSNFTTLLTGSLQGRQLDTFNLSTPILNPNFPNDGRIDALVKFAQQVVVRQFDFNRQGMGSTQAAKLSPIITNLDALDISSNQLTDVDFLVNKTENLKTLKVGNNPLGNPGIASLMQQSQNSSLTELDVSQTEMDEEGLENIGQSLLKNKLNKLNVSGNDLSLAEMNAFGKAVSDSTLEDISLSQTNLSDQQAIDFTSSAKEGMLKKADFSNNDLTDQGAAGVVSASQNGTLSFVNLGGNSITNKGVEGMVVDLAKTAIEEVGLSATQISGKGFGLLANQPQLKSLDVSYNPYGDEFVDVLAQSKTNLEQVDISFTEMTETGSTNLTTGILKNPQFTSLHAAGNQLSDTAFVPIAQALPFSNISDIDFSQNVLGLSSAQALADVLPNTRLETVDLKNNEIPDEGGVAIAETLITSTPHRNQTDQKEIISGIQDVTRDEVRAMRQAKPATKLKKLNLENNPLGKGSKRAFNRVLPSTPIHFYHNNPNQTFFAPRNLPASEQTNNNNNTQYLRLFFLTGTTPLVFGLIVIYLIYRMLTKNQEEAPCEKPPHTPTPP